MNPPSTRVAHKRCADALGVDNLLAVSDTLSSNGSSASSSRTLKQRNVELIVPVLVFPVFLLFMAFIISNPSFNEGTCTSSLCATGTSRNHRISLLNQIYSATKPPQSGRWIGVDQSYSTCYNRCGTYGIDDIYMRSRIHRLLAG